MCAGYQLTNAFSVCLWMTHKTELNLMRTNTASLLKPCSQLTKLCCSSGSSEDRYIEMTITPDRFSIRAYNHAVSETESYH